MGIKSNIPKKIKKHNRVGIHYKKSLGRPYGKIRTDLTPIRMR